MQSTPAIRQPNPPSQLPYPRPRHPIRRDATRVLAGLFDRPWKSSPNAAVLVTLPNGSKAATSAEATTSAPKPTAPTAPQPTPQSAPEDRGFGSPIISVVAAAMAKKDMGGKTGVGGAKSAKPTVARRQSDLGPKSGATAAGTSKPKAPSNLSKELTLKLSTSASAKTAKSSDTGASAPLIKSATAPSVAAFTNHNNKRPIDSVLESSSPPPSAHDLPPMKKPRKSAPAKFSAKPSSTSTSDTSVSASQSAAPQGPKKGWKGWVALSDSESTDGRGRGRRDEDDEDLSSERTPTPPPKGRKGWKGWAIASSPPDESKLILIDKVPVIKGRITRSGRSFGERGEGQEEGDI